MPFYCNQCSYIGNSQQKLDNHMKSHDPLIIAERTCELCDTKFTSKYNRDKHYPTCKSRSDNDALLKCIDSLRITVNKGLLNETRLTSKVEQLEDDIEQIVFC